MEEEDERDERETDKQKEGFTERGREMENNPKLISLCCTATLLLRISVIFYIAAYVHTNTDRCHMETLMPTPPSRNWGRPPNLRGLTVGPIQLKNGVISLFPHLGISAIWKWMYWSQGFQWELTGLVIDFTLSESSGLFHRAWSQIILLYGNRRFLLIWTFIMSRSKWFHSLHDNVLLTVFERLGLLESVSLS